MMTYRPSPQTQQLLADLEAASATPYGLYNFHEIAPRPSDPDDAVFYRQLLVVRAEFVARMLTLARGATVVMNPADYVGVAVENPQMTERLQAWLTGRDLWDGRPVASDIVHQFATGEAAPLPPLATAPPAAAPPSVMTAPAGQLAPAAPAAAAPAPVTAATVVPTPSGPVIVYSGGGGGPAPAPAAPMATAAPRSGSPYWWQNALVRTTEPTVGPVARAPSRPVVSQPPAPAADWWSWLLGHQGLAFGGAAAVVVVLAAVASGGRR